MKRVFLATIAALCMMMSAGSCGGHKVVAKLDAEDTFSRGMEYFNKKKYVEAMDDFREVVYNYSGTKVAAEASYYLGETYLNTKDYQSAIDEYNHLSTDYPSNAFAEKALVRMAQAYHKMSPHYALDQVETADKAKSTLQLYFERYPDGPSKGDAAALMLEVDEKLARKDYEAGMIYFKMKQYSSSKIYFEEVVKEYPNTTWAAKSKDMLADVEPLIKEKTGKSMITDTTKAVKTN